jgi:hypothetical protein
MRIERRSLQVKTHAVVSMLSQLLDLNYYDAFEAIGAFLHSMMATHPGLLVAEIPLVVNALLGAYNTLPVEESARLVKVVESVLDAMANKLDAHSMMEVRLPSPVSSSLLACVRRSR